MVVLDDFHRIEEKEVIDTVEAMLNCAPPHAHFIIGSRTPLPFSISRLKINNQLDEISQQELSFSNQEALTFVKSHLPISESPQNAHNLIARLDGWITGLKILCQSPNLSSICQDTSSKLKEIKTLSNYLSE